VDVYADAKSSATRVTIDLERTGDYCIRTRNQHIRSLSVYCNVTVVCLAGTLC